MSTQVVLRRVPPSIGWTWLEKHYSPASVGAGVVLLGNFNYIQHKAGADLEFSHLAAKTLEAEMYANRCAVPDTVITGGMTSLPPHEDTTVSGSHALLC